MHVVSCLHLAPTGTDAKLLLISIRAGQDFHTTFLPSGSSHAGSPVPRNVLNCWQPVPTSTDGTGSPLAVTGYGTFQASLPLAGGTSIPEKVRSLDFISSHKYLLAALHGVQNLCAGNARLQPLSGWELGRGLSLHSVQM